MNILKQAQKIRDLEKSNAQLFAKTIIMLIELETIAEDPGSDKSKEIITRYRGRIQRRNEREQAT